MGLEIRPVTDVVGLLREVTGRGATAEEDVDSDVDGGRSVGVGARDAPGSLLQPRPAVADVEFLFHLSRRFVRQARDDAVTSDPARSPILGWVAEGTLDAVLWILGATDVGPSGCVRDGELRDGLRVDEALTDEDAAVSAIRALAPSGTRDYCYFGGASDVLCFARGLRVDYWWAPLPEPLRRDPARDEIGRALR